VDKYDAIRHTANPGAQEQEAEQDLKRKRKRRGKKKECVRKIHVTSNILQDEMFELPNACRLASRQKERRGGKGR